MSRPKTLAQDVFSLNHDEVSRLFLIITSKVIPNDPDPLVEASFRALL